MSTETEQNSACIFCKILAGEIPAHKVYEDDRCVAIMDAFPITNGQVLLIGHTHADYIFDIDEDLYAHLFAVTRTLGNAIDTALPTERTWIIVQGMEVPHVHIKLLPVYAGAHINLEEGSGAPASDRELSRYAQKIKNALDR